MDAAPLIGTAASYGLMKDIIQEGLLSDLETDMWLSSLAFQAKPTSDMIAVVAVRLLSLDFFFYTRYNNLSSISAIASRGDCSS